MRFAYVYLSTRTRAEKSTVEYLGYICAGLNISLAEFFAEEQSEKNVAGRTTDALNEKQKRLLDEFLSSL